jgi:hypothetical protein
MALLVRFSWIWDTCAGSGFFELTFCVGRRAVLNKTILSLLVGAAITIVGMSVCAAQTFFSYGGSFDIGERPISLAVGDVTGTGAPDLVAANVGYYSEADSGFIGRSFSVFENDGAGGFSEYLHIDIADTPEAVAVADVNADTLQDIILATADQGITVFLNNGVDFLEVGPQGTGAIPVKIVVADIDGDTVPDVVTANNGSDDISVLLGNGDGSFSVAQNYDVGAAPSDLCMADFDGDGYLDVAVANSFGSTVSLLFGAEDGSLMTGDDVEVGEAPRVVVAGFLDDDQNRDLAVGSFLGESVLVLGGNGNGAFTAIETLSVGQSVTDLLAIDINGDGVDELLVASGDNTFRVYESTSEGFSLAEAHDTGDTPISILAHDLNASGRDDAAVAAYNDGSVTLFWRITGSEDEGEGETPAEGEGETSTEGEGETPAEGEGETPAEGEGETPAEGEGETTTEGEGETKTFGCSGGTTTNEVSGGNPRGDALLIAFVGTMLLLVSRRRRVSEAD